MDAGFFRPQRGYWRAIGGASAEVLRSAPLVQMLAAVQGKSPEQLDDFFRTYARS